MKLSLALTLKLATQFFFFQSQAREVMQLFSIGLVVLNDDGRPVFDDVTGQPLETYTNEDIESFARAWTGFDRTAARGNYEESRTGT